MLCFIIISALSKGRELWRRGLLRTKKELWQIWQIAPICYDSCMPMSPIVDGRMCGNSSEKSYWFYWQTKSNYARTVTICSHSRLFRFRRARTSLVDFFTFQLAVSNEKCPNLSSLFTYFKKSQKSFEYLKCYGDDLLVS